MHVIKEQNSLDIMSSSNIVLRIACTVYNNNLCSLLTGLKVNRLDLYGEKYKPFKGVKYITKAGKFQVRT